MYMILQIQIFNSEQTLLNSVKNINILFYNNNY
jgi:hypothetical protein